MDYREIAPFIFIETSQGSSEFVSSSLSSQSYVSDSWAPIPALTAELSKLIRSESIYRSLTHSPGYVPLKVLVEDSRLSQYSAACIVSSLAKLPYLNFTDTPQGLVFSLNVIPIKIASNLRPQIPSLVGQTQHFNKNRKYRRNAHPLYVRYTDGYEKVFRNDNCSTSQRNHNRSKNRNIEADDLGNALSRISLSEITNNTQKIIKGLLN